MWRQISGLYIDFMGLFHNGAVNLIDLEHSTKQQGDCSSLVKATLLLL